MSSSIKGKLLPILIVGGLGAVICLWLLMPQKSGGKVPPDTGRTDTISPITNLVETPPSSGAISRDSSPAAPLKRVCDGLAAAAGPGNAQHDLTELRATLSTMATNEAVVMIRKFLDSKSDASTHLGFKIGGKGLLDEAPTLRVWLLDELGRLDPGAAADYAKVILAGKDSPDEWAVALRNLARGDVSDGGRELLAEKTGELLQYTPWQENPSAGYLEAFDVAVYLGGNTLIPALTGLVRSDDNPAIAHASYLALDRLVINEPHSALKTLLADPGLMQGRETTRADYFARADVRDLEQRQLVESYLLDPRITPAETAAFAGIFPNANFMVSQNLLTQSPTIDRNTLVDRDTESLHAIQAWLADPQFAQVRGPLQTAQRRLEEFVRQEETQ